MSGGSMSYLYSSVQDASFQESTPERKALRLHLNKLAKALQAVEWNDSGDGADDESELIREAIGGQIILEASIQAAKGAHKDLSDQLARVEGSWLSEEMQTPAKGFPVIHALKIGDTVELPSDLPECGGLRLRGVLISFPKFGDSEVLLQIGNGPKQYINVPTYRLVHVPEPMGQGRMVG